MSYIFGKQRMQGYQIWPRAGNSAQAPCAAPPQILSYLQPSMWCTPPRREFRATSGNYRMFGRVHYWEAALLPPLRPNYDLRRANNIWNLPKWTIRELLESIISSEPVREISSYENGGCADFSTIGFQLHRHKKWYEWKWNFIKFPKCCVWKGANLPVCEWN